jgi:DeoR/GlpR family transcriptional regulator of sugar metabolism
VAGVLAQSVAQTSPTVGITGCAWITKSGELLGSHSMTKSRSETPMDADDRQHQILNLLTAKGEVSNAEVAERLGVSEMTIRRDLSQLESEGLLRRVYGGAARAAGSSIEPPFAMRARQNVDAKRAIAASVAAEVKDGQTLVLDGGTTGTAIAEALVGRELTVCVLNLRVADILNISPATRVMSPGGFIRHGEQSLSGPIAEHTLRHYHFDLYVMTVSGISVDAGMTEWDAADAAVKRAALNSSARCIVACDASKFGQTAFASIAPLRAVDAIVTDAALTADHRHALDACGAVLHIA